MEPAHLDVPWSNIIQAILAISFGAWAWLLRKFGESHISTIKDLANEMREVRRELIKLSERVAQHEVWLSIQRERGYDT